MPLISSIAIYNAIYEICKINIGIKWPNDILCNEKKIAGILIESKLNEMKMKRKKIIYFISQWQLRLPK